MIGASLMVMLAVLSVNGKLPPVMGKVRPGCTPDERRFQCVWFNDRCKGKDENCTEGRMCCGVQCGTACVEPNVCTLPKVVGACKSKVQRWYYDLSKGKCRRFNYSGCNGNTNNFKTEKECRKGTKQCACLLEKKTGPCKASIRMYFYNYRTHRCEEFIYGGCKGNKNRFETKSDCKEGCKSILEASTPLPPLLPPKEKCSPRGPAPCGSGPGGGPPCSPGFFCGPHGLCCHYCEYGIPHRIKTCNRSAVSDCPPEHYCENHPDAKVTACCPNAVPSSKPGVCPNPGPNKPCDKKCKADKDCDGTKKCCDNGCGRVCLEPLGPKVGFCQVIPPATPGVCVNYCNDDKQCPGSEKCCSNGCGKSCKIGSVIE